MASRRRSMLEQLLGADHQMLALGSSLKFCASRAARRISICAWADVRVGHGGGAVRARGGGRRGARSAGAAVAVQPRASRCSIRISLRSAIRRRIGRSACGGCGNDVAGRSARGGPSLLLPPRERRQCGLLRHARGMSDAAALRPRRSAGIMAALRDPNAAARGISSRTSTRSRRTRSRKPTRSPMRSTGAIATTCATSSAICCCRSCSMRAWPRRRDISISATSSQAICSKMTAAASARVSATVRMPTCAEQTARGTRSRPTSARKGRCRCQRARRHLARHAGVAARAETAAACGARSASTGLIDPVFDKLHEELDEVRAEFAQRRRSGAAQRRDRRRAVRLRQSRAACEGGRLARAAPRQREVRAALPAMEQLAAGEGGSFARARRWPRRSALWQRAKTQEAQG